MTSKGRPISEEDLHGFVDGLLDPERQAAVERVLRDDRAAAQRIDGWRASREALHAAYHEAPVPPIPSSLNVSRLVLAHNARRWSPASVAAGITLALAVGGGLGWFAHAPTRPVGLATLAAQAADAHRVFAEDLVHSVEYDASALPAQLSWIDQRVGHRLTVPDLSASGYRLLGARLVATPQGPACLFLYDGARLGTISILMRSMHDADRDTPMQPVEAPGASGFAWARQGLGVSLLSNAPSEALHVLSNQVRDALATRT